MPTYEYHCDCCGSQFDIRQTFKDAPVAFCPRCNAKARRIISAPSIIFKGDGFYVTENRPKHSESDEKPAVKSVAKPVEKPAALPAEKPDSAAKS